MPYYSETDLMATGQQLAEALRVLNARVEAVEAKPALNSLQQEWAAGQRLAKSKGYSGKELEALEAEMVSRGVASHADMMQLRPKAGGRINLMATLEQNEIDMLMNGDDNGFLDSAIPRALADERSR